MRLGLEEAIINRQLSPEKISKKLLSRIEVYKYAYEKWNNQEYQSLLKKIGYDEIEFIELCLNTFYKWNKKLRKTSEIKELGKESPDLTPYIEDIITLRKFSKKILEIPVKTKELALELVNELYSFDYKNTAVERTLDLLKMLLDSTSEFIDFVFGAKLSKSYAV